ncbi:MAG TPA: polysaccharide biosynthesis/export family protein [Stellaceae bacterium]|nr:polysaccharide biosynthesis/export family protein [Stellaceae bacterium]
MNIGSSRESSQAPIRLPAACRRRGGVAGLGLACALAGCTSPPNQPTPPVAAQPEAPAAENLPSYRLQVGDVIDVHFQVNSELNEEVTVRPDGMISTSVATEIPVYDHTVPEATQLIRTAYQAQHVTAVPNLIVRSFSPTRIYVGGEVVNPGEFLNVGPDLTVSQAIARAGGIKNSADFHDVLVLRHGAGTKPTVYSVDYYEATQGGRADLDSRLAPFDVVFVPRTGVAQVYVQFQQYIQQFMPNSLDVTVPVSSTGLVH